MRPLLDKWSRGEDFWKEWGTIVDDHSPVGDHCVALLLDMQIDAGFADEVTVEVTKRGRRVLELLRMYRVRRPEVLVRRYPTLYLDDIRQRMHRFESFIETIELGEVYDH